MPKYTKSNPDYKGFHNARHIMQYLTRTSKESKDWKYFVNAAKKHNQTELFLSHRALTKIKTRHPKELAKDVLHEMKKHKRGEKTGGGITEAFHWFSNATRIPGYLRNLIWDPYNHRTIPNEKQEIALALQKTYDEKRPAKVGSLSRIPKYDADRYAVWREPNGQMLITVHGTTLSGADIRDDLAIAVGFSKTESDELNQLIQTFEKENITFDIAGHSLATTFIQNLDLDNADSIYLFNPASSPLQSTSTLTERANDPQYQYFINPSDLVSDALFQKMEKQGVDNSYIGEFKFSPLAAHSLSQWIPNEDEIETSMDGDADEIPEKHEKLTPYEISVLRQKTGGQRLLSEGVLPVNHS